MDAARREALGKIRDRLGETSSVVLTTHVNPDGDGVGSMSALARRLVRKGVDATIVTPGRPPPSLAFLLADLPVFADEDPAAADPLERADALVILDTAEPKRLGRLAEHAPRLGGVLIDHHPPVGSPLVEPAIRDPSASATGELIFDLLSLDDIELERAEADGLYAAIVTDTGSFRFSNTTPRAHAIAAVLLGSGVDCAAMNRALYGSYSRRRLSMIKLGLERLEADPEAPVAWIALDCRTVADSGGRSDDLEGLVDFPRRLEGMEVGFLIRGLSRDRTKVSLRSNGKVDVSDVARRLGGGGHVHASGALVDLGLQETLQLVLGMLRPLAEAAGRT